MAHYNSVTCQYEDLTRFLNGKNRKILANNTIVFKEDESIKVQYHSSVIACLDENTVILTNDGFFTSTTKDRLNWFIDSYGYKIFQEKNTWKVYDYRNRETIGVFTGKVVYSIPENQFTGLSIQGKERENTFKRISAYAKKYADLFLERKIDSPSGEDCRYCYMAFPDSFDHFESHMKEKYYVPSLLMKAIEFKRVSLIVRNVISIVWNKDSQDISFLKDIAYDQISKSLVAYMRYCYDQSNK